MNWAETGTPGLSPIFYGGYLWSDKEVFLNMAMRRINHNLSGWGDQQSYRRTAVTIEAARSLFDYHGFVPFVGVGVSSESLSFQDRPSGAVGRTVESTSLRPALLVGWDIRPTKTLPWIIRTSLRYTPGLKMNLAGQAVPAADLEFDFFQFVFYPKRFGRK